MRSIVFQGKEGRLEGRIYTPDCSASGLCFITHPHSLFGGCMDNKVVHCLNQSFLSRGFITVLHNFRGVGFSEGQFDDGNGESEDLSRVYDTCLQHPEIRSILPKQFPIACSGFSFGTYVIQNFLKTHTVDFAVLVGCAPNKWNYAPPANNVFLIHGSADEVAPIASVYEWLQSTSFPITVLPGASHFFDRKLTALKKSVTHAIDYNILCTQD